MVGSYFQPSRVDYTILLALAVSLLTCPTMGQPSSPSQNSQQQAVPSVSRQLPAEVQAKLDNLQAALKTERAAGDGKAEAKSLNEIGKLYFGVSDFAQALDFYNQALGICRSAGDRAGEGKALLNIGNAHLQLGESQKALDFCNQALAIFQQTGDRGNEAIALLNTGNVYSVLGQYRKALEFFNRALPISQALGDRASVASNLNNIGEIYDIFGEKQKALEHLIEALSNYRAVGDRSGESQTLSNIGDVYSGLGDKQKALEYYNQALPIKRGVGDRVGEATALNDIGTVHSDLGDKQRALEYFNQALPIYRATGVREGEASTLVNIGNVYSVWGEKQKSLDDYGKALTIYRSAGERDGEGTTLMSIGNVHSELGENQKALECFNQALPILREVSDRGSEALTLMNIGNVYSNLSEKQTALEYYNQALPILQAVGDRSAEALTRVNIGNIYSDFGQKKKALEFYNQALPIQQAVGDRRGEAATLSNIGIIYSDLSDKQRALNYYNQALPTHRAMGDLDGEAIVLANIGNLYDDLGDKQKAFEFHNQALPIATDVNDPLLEANILRSMYKNQKAKNPSLAIFYAKHAVNLLQRMRSDIQGLEKGLQKSFLASKENYYRDLADLLIEQGRLPEAQQVLDLLKEQEYSDYTRGESAGTMSPLAFTPAEQQAEDDYQKSTAQIVALGEEWSDLRKISQRTPDQEVRFKQVSAQIEAANAGLSDYYNRLYLIFISSGDANKQLKAVTGDVDKLGQALVRMPRTVALYTLVSKDRTSIIVITRSTRVAREYAISEADLNKKIAAFEQMLRNPASDPKAAAQELYNILIGPVKNDLSLAHAETLVWSLDGALRYIPMAALYDGTHYLAEQYNMVTVTPVSMQHLESKPDVSNLSAAAMGISRKYEANLPELKAVVGELDEVVNDPRMKGANGVLPGTILLDNEFTEQAMENHLSGQYAVVHIASHFVFKPGDDRQSYLLLADKDATGKGFHLTVADFHNNPNLELTGTELLTLSACDTGMSGTTSDGREVDGLGTMALGKGAKAVISTLWEVDDASTGQLMADFYKRWAAGGGKVEKVEALRQAQLDLLLGRMKIQSGSNGRGFSVVENGPGQQVQAGYTHPYYWAPFVLMGNWR